MRRCVTSRRNVSRNSLEYEGFRISPVEDFTIFAGFSCLGPDDTDRDFDEFIQCDAEQHFRDKIAVTYVLCPVENKSLPLGFATLQNDAIRLKDDIVLPGVCDNYSYKSFPAVKIGRFGISIDYQGGRLGSLFLYMIKRLLVTENRTGCRFITVDARRDKKKKVDVSAFYRKNHFERLPTEDKTSQYIPMYFDLIQFP